MEYILQRKNKMILFKTWSKRGHNKARIIYHSCSISKIWSEMLFYFIPIPTKLKTSPSSNSTGQFIKIFKFKINCPSKDIYKVVHFHLHLIINWTIHKAESKFLTFAQGFGKFNNYLGLKEGMNFIAKLLYNLRFKM